MLVHLECMSFGHDVRCTLRLVMWALVRWVREAKGRGSRLGDLDRGAAGVGDYILDFQ